LFRQSGCGKVASVATNDIFVRAAPARVFDVLADASRYAEWVVGAQDVLDADAAWPDDGAELTHRSGVGPAGLTDVTEVLESEPPRRLVLLAHLSRLGSLRVELVLTAEGEGTRVRMDEEPVSGPSATLHNPLGDLALNARNVLSLQRLRDLAES
jgi:uncharacterized protein YndB with AHSA1/START domain